MAEVWRAYDLKLNRLVAVKLLKAQLASDPTAVTRFSREAETVAQLAHPNIVAVYDTVTHEGHQAVVMQLVEGESLRERLDKRKRLDPEEVLDIAAAVAAGLDAAHQANVVHRDVKPGNILLADDGRILLTDFGIAKGTEPNPADDLTSENVMMGTAKYLAPEQVRGRPLDGRADLYSLGLVLYECLAGKVPFKGPTDAETALARVQRDPTPLGRLRPQLAPGLLQLVDQLLARNPSKRPSSGTDVVALVERIRSGRGLSDSTPWPVLPRPDEPKRQPRTTPDPERRRPASNDRPTSPRPGRSTPSGPGASTPGRSRPGSPPSAGNRKTGRHTTRRRATPAMIAGVAIALVAIAVAVWALTRDNDTAPARDTSITAPSGAAGTPQVTTADGQLVPITDSQVSALTSYDPKADGTENESRVRLARDGNTDTAWLTNCYQNQYFGAKQGVGVIVRLSGPAQGILRLDFPGTPWNVDIYASDTPAAEFDDWGSPVSQNASQRAKATEIVLNEPGNYLLVMLREVGRDSSCSSANPFRGGLSEVSFGPATAD